MTPRQHTRIPATLLAAIVASTVVACGGSPPSHPEPRKVGPVAGEAAVDEPFVAFRQAALVIDRLETPVAPPVTAGSRPSPATMASDAPDVVAILDDGSLVAHRNGRATIRALQGAGALTVEVLAASGLRAEPPVLRISPGKSPLPVLKAGGATIPAASVAWFSNAPGIAMVEDGRVRAGPSKGTATLTAVYGGEKVQVTVVVANREPRRK